LEPQTRLLAVYLITALRTAGIPAIITSARRSYAEQIKLVMAGKSRTFNSRHLTGKAFDIDVSGWSRQDIPRWFWDAVGPYAERLGLKWPLPDWDPAHFET